MRGARGAAAVGRGVVVGPLGGALALVPVWGARGGREIATVRAPQRLGGGSRRVRAGQGVVSGRNGAGQSSADGSRDLWWSPARVNM